MIIIKGTNLQVVCEEGNADCTFSQGGLLDCLTFSSKLQTYTVISSQNDFLLKMFQRAPEMEMINSLGFPKIQ